MQVHRDEGVAPHIGPKPCAGIREDVGEASAGERAGQPLSRDRKLIPGADTVCVVEGDMSKSAIERAALPAQREQWRLGVERANYEAQRAERRYRAVDPDNRLVARGLERDWEERLRALEAAKIELERREKQRPRVISQAERDRLLALGPDLAAVWNAPTTTPRDRKELLRTLIEDVTIQVDRDKAAAHLALRWKGGALNEIDLTLPRSRPATVRTDEDTIALLRRLAAH